MIPKTQAGRKVGLILSWTSLGSSCSKCKNLSGTRRELALALGAMASGLYACQPYFPNMG